MNDIKLIAIDLAKNVFQVCALDQHNQVIFNKQLRRSQLTAFIAKLPPSPVFLEACYSAHYWARTFNSLGHQAHLIPAQHVTPFVRGNKNDHNDALAIAEAAQRPHIRWVPVKSEAQQEILALHRVRQRLIKSRTQITNQVRGLLSDFGIVFPQGFSAFRNTVNTIEQQPLSPAFRQIISECKHEFDDTSERIKNIEQQLTTLCQHNPSYQLLLSIPGFGLITASALLASIDRGQAFKSPKEVGVWLGFTPRRYDSGQTRKSGAMSKRGDRYLRTQLTHGARATLRWARNRDDPLSLWINQTIARRGIHKATVATAHKLVRIAWILLQRQEHFKLYPKQV